MAARPPRRGGSNRARPMRGRAGREATYPQDVASEDSERSDGARRGRAPIRGNLPRRAAQRPPRRGGIRAQEIRAGDERTPRNNQPPADRFPPPPPPGGPNRPGGGGPPGGFPSGNQPGGGGGPPPRGGGQNPLARPGGRGANDFLSNAAAEGAPCPDNDKRAYKGLTSLGFKVHEYTAQFPHPHPVSAGVRHMAVVRAFVELYKRGCRKVLSIWGSTRDVRIAARLNRGVPIADQMEVRVFQAVQTSQDLARLQPDQTIATDADFSWADAYFFCDVYHMVEPDQLRVWTQHKPALWLGHVFSGVAGHIEGEGLWVRAGSLISSRADPTSQTYGPHPACDHFLTSNSCQHTVWAIADRVGSFSVVWIETVRIYVPVSVSQPPRPAVMEVRLPLPDLSTWWGALLWQWLPYSLVPKWLAQERIVWVHTALYPHLRQYLLTRSRTSFAYRQLGQKAQEFASRDTLLTLMGGMRPDVQMRVLQETTTAAFVADVDSVVDLHRAVRSGPSHAIAELNTDLLAIDEPLIQRIHWKPLLCVAGLAGLYFATRRMVLPGSFFSALHGIQPDFRRLMDKVARVVYPYVGAAVTKLTKWTALHMGKLGWTPALQSAVKSMAPVIAMLTVRDIVIAPIFEEWLKNRYPVLGWFLVGTETCAHFLMWGPWMTCKVLGMHIVAYVLGRQCGLAVGVAVHGGWNAVAVWRFLSRNLLSGVSTTLVGPTLGSFAALYAAWLPNVQRGHWSQFVEAYYLAPWEERPAVWEDITAVEEFKLETGIVTKESRAKFDPVARDPQLKVRVVGICPEETSKTKVYWFLPTNVPGYSPGRTAGNLEAVFRARILVPAPLSHDGDQALAWEPVDPHTFITCGDPEIRWEDHYSAWLNHIDDGAKKRRMMREAAIFIGDPLALSDRSLKKTQVMVKTDELLYRLTSDGFPQMKPRSIMNLHPRVQVVIGPYIYEATRRLKEVWSWEAVEPCHTHNGTKYYVVFASAATDHLLTQWWRKVEARLLDCDEYHILVAGDDLLIVECRQGRAPVFIEGDASMFDQSQGSGPLSYECEALEILGVPAQVTSWLYELAHNRLCGYSRDYAWKMYALRKDRPMRDTGGPDTTLGNSLVMGASTIYALKTQTESCTLQEAYLRLGLKMKLQYHTHISEPTFLKGRWYATSQGRVWGPLPSRFLKMGKALVDPQVLYRKRNRQEATKLFANDVACSYAQFIQVPLIAEFVRAHLIGPKIRDLRQPHEVAGTGLQAQLDRPSTLHELSVRYDVTPRDFVECEAQIAGSRLGTWLAHPLYVRLAIKDYA